MHKYKMEEERYSDNWLMHFYGIFVKHILIGQHWTDNVRRAVYKTLTCIVHTPPDSPLLPPYDVCPGYKIFDKIDKISVCKDDLCVDGMMMRNDSNRLIPALLTVAMTTHVVLIEDKCIVFTVGCCR